MRSDIGLDAAADGDASRTIGRVHDDVPERSGDFRVDRHAATARIAIEHASGERLADVRRSKRSRSRHVRNRPGDAEACSCMPGSNPYQEPLVMTLDCFCSRAQCPCTLADAVRLAKEPNPARIAIFGENA